MMFLVPKLPKKENTLRELESILTLNDKIQNNSDEHDDTLKYIDLDDDEDIIVDNSI